MQQHVTVLGILFIVFGALGLVGACVVLFLLGGAAGIVGLVAENEPATRIAVPVLGLVAVGLFFFISILSLPGIVAGIGLVKLKSWARILGLILSVVKLLNVPFGTILGVYGLWVLLAPETEALFRKTAEATGTTNTGAS